MRRSFAPHRTGAPAAVRSARVRALHTVRNKIPTSGPGNAPASSLRSSSAPQRILPSARCGAFRPSTPSVSIAQHITSDMNQS